MRGATPLGRTLSRTSQLEAKSVPSPGSQATALAELGLEAGKQVRRELLRRLHAGDVKFACRMTRTRTVFVLDYAGREFCLLYSNSTKEILRFLPPNAPELENGRKEKARLARNARQNTPEVTP